MLIIRDEQAEAFLVPVDDDFRKWVAIHLEQFFPDQCAQLGARAIDDVVEYGIQRAKLYAIHDQANVCAYLNLMFVLGRDFDAAPHLPWAGAILGDKSIASASARTERLHGESMRYLRRLADNQAEQ